jgi:Galactose oxidase, central domain
MKTNRIVRIAIMLCALALNPLFIHATKAGTFTATGSLNTGRYGHTATLLPSGKVLVAGGVDTNGNPTASAELYDPATGTWTYTTPMNSPHFLHTATLLPNGKVLIFGNNGTWVYSFTDINGTEYVFSPLFEIYDPATETWANSSYVTNLYIMQHTATLLPNGKVLIAGGANTPSGSVSSAELFDPATDTWMFTGSTSIVRDQATAVLLTNGQVLIAGGAPGVIYSAELYDPNTGTWTNTAPMNEPRGYYPTSTLLPNGQVFVAGGDEDEYYQGINSELYDPVAGTWTLTTGLVCFGNTATLLPSGRVFMAGGAQNDFYSYMVLASAQSYDPVRGDFKQTGNMITARDSFTSTLLTNGQVLIAGGITNCELYNPNGGLPVVMQSINRAASGAFQFSFTNTPSLNFGILATTNLTIPIANWPEIAIIYDSGIGQYQFSDIQATNYPQRFYELNPP